MSDHEHHGPEHLAHHFKNMDQQFETNKLGMWVFLATEILMFGGLFCAYAIYRSTNPDVYLFAHQYLDTKWGAINTIVLLASSLTMAWGVRCAQLGQQGLLKIMLILTLLGGAGFMCIKFIEYKAKWDHGLFMGDGNVAMLGKGNAFRLEGGLLADPEAAEHAIDYLKKHDSDHGDDHGGDHGSEHNGDHSDDDAHGGDHSGDDTGDHSGDHADDPAHAEDEAAYTAEQALALAEAADAEAAMGEASGEHSDGHGDQSLGSALAAAAARTPASASARSIPTPKYEPVGVNETFAASEDLHASGGAHHGSHYPEFDEMRLLDRQRTGLFFQIYFMMTGLHGIHVLIGMGLIAWLLGMAYRGAWSPQRFAPVDLIGLYWHLVDLIWIFLFPLLYLIH